MRKDIYKMINWWLDKGISGFRVDAINFIKKDQRWCDGEVDGADGLSACFQFCRNKEVETFIGKTGCFSMMFDFMYSNLDITKNEEWFPDQDWSIKAYKDALFAS